MKPATAFLVSIASIALPIEAISQTITTEQKTLIAKLCQNDSACEQAQTKQYSAFKAAQKSSIAAATGGKAGQATGSQPAKPPAEQKSSNILPTLSKSFPFPGNCSGTSNQAIFIRSDSLDNFNYVDQLVSVYAGVSSGTSPNSVAKGASIAYTDNRNAATQNAAINARLSYLLIGRAPCEPAPQVARDPSGAVIFDPATQQPVMTSGDTRQPFISGFAFAPFVSSQGTWNEPFTTTTTTTKASSKTSPTGTESTTTVTSSGKTMTTITNSKGTITTTTQKTSTSALRFGVDLQTEVSTTFFPLNLQDHYLYLSPFYQTDYRGLAQIGGVDFSWQPVSLPLNLGVQRTYEYFTFLWQFKAEAELTQVNDPGYTNFVGRGGHDQFGEAIRVNVGLFPHEATPSPGKWFDDHVADRLSFIGTQQYYYDAATRQNAPYYSAILQYKLGACTRDPKKTDDSPCSISGSSSLALEYDWGRNNDTYVNTNQFKVTLNFSY